MIRRSKAPKQTFYMSEADFERLPRAVQTRMLAICTEADSGVEGIYAFEIPLYRWPEIEHEWRHEAARIPPEQRLHRFKKNILYMNDYHCGHDQARWSRVGCTAGKLRENQETCPVCQTSLKPENTEEYMVIEWRPSLWVRCRTAVRRLWQALWHSRASTSADGNIRFNAQRDGRR